MVGGGGEGRDSGALGPVSGGKGGSGQAVKGRFAVGRQGGEETGRGRGRAIPKSPPPYLRTPAILQRPARPLPWPCLCLVAGGVRLPGVSIVILPLALPLERDPG
jgi:hypothetical protein